MKKLIYDKEIKLGTASSTKLETYRFCPLAWKLRHLDHVKSRPSPALVFGRSIHYLAKKFYSVRYKSDITLTNYWKRYWKELTDKDDTIQWIDRKKQYWEYHHAGCEILKKFYNRYSHDDKPDHLEKHFNFIFAGVKLIGSLDRVEKHDGKIILVDYKTDKFPPVKGSPGFDHSLQFTIYSLACMNLFGVFPHKIYNENLRDGIRYETVRTDKDYGYLESEIKRISKRINERDFNPVYGHHCTFCSFESYCGANPFSTGKKIDPAFQTEMNFSVDTA